MFCPKCGTPLNEGEMLCQNCGFNIAEVKRESVIKPISNEEKGTENDKQADKGNPIIKVVYIGLAAAVLIMFFVAANDIVKGGEGIMQIESVGGKTLEEAYYYELGMVYAGYAMVARALGVFFSAVLVWLGLKK